MRIIPKKIEGVRFGLLSPDHIRKISEARIITADTYDEDGYPIEGGLMDPKLGVVDPGLKCKTCGGRVGDCPGHFGRIELARPVIHVGYAKQINRLLQSTCRKCGRLLLPEEKIEEYREQIKKARRARKNESDVVEEIFKAAKVVKRCPYCGEEQLEIKFEKPTTFVEDRNRLSSTDVRERLERIKDKDAEAIGFDLSVARPEWIVLTVLPVPPVTVRPSITLESGERSEDDLTHKLVDILRINQRLTENVEAGAPQLIIEDLWELLQYHVTTYFNNEVAGVPPARHRSGRPLKTITQRLKGKEGRFRSNLSGKRVNFSARTVISPDPNISINEVGVPEIIARELTVPVRVTLGNIEYLKKLVENGPEKYPGANYVERVDGSRVRLGKVKNTEEVLEKVEVGGKVHRHLQDGDVVMFNRQPSLHRMSMMAHEIRIMPYKTFRLNLCVCVAPETKVLLGGTQRRIEELKNCWKESLVITYDTVNKSIIPTELKAFWGLKPEQYGETCYRVITNTGREITATGDHPFYTKDGKKPAEKLKVGNKVIVYPQEFPEYEEKDFEIVSENDIITLAPEETYIKHTLEELKKCKLIPLRLLNNPKAIILARLLGHLFGDGMFILKGNELRAIFHGDEGDLKDAQRDIKFLGFEPEKIVRRSSKGKIRTAKGKMLEVRGRGCSFEVRSKPFGILLNALGAPNGDKVKTNFSVPAWIMRAPAYIKKEFLSAYFGCELSKPKVRKSCKKMFKEPVFKMSKTEDRIEFGLKFAERIIKILDRDFGIKARLSKESGNIRKDGTKTVVIKTTIRSDIQNLINLYGKIGYAYNRIAETLARYAYQYLKVKCGEIERRNRILEKVKPAKRGEIIKFAKEENIPVNTLYQWRYKNQNRSVTSPDFSDFDDWVEQNSAGNGFVYETVEKIEEKSIPYVYDITTSAETHNFIANGFLTGNCPPYNADFDGDEMNLHAIQGEEARAEARILMRVQEQILSPRFGGPIIGGIHDHISGAYLLTRKETKFTVEEAFQILYASGIQEQLPEPIVENGEEYCTGKQLFSLLLPRDLNLVYRAKICKKHDTCLKEGCQADAYVVVRNGQLLSGVMDEKSFGAFAGELLDRIVKDYGTDEARKFLDKVTKLAINVITRKGFSTGIDDEDLPNEAKERIAEILDKAGENVQKLIEAYEDGILEQLPGRTLEETLEMRIMQTLSEARDKTGSIANEYLEQESEVRGRENSARIMAVTGARGSLLNLTQMAACIGQQAVRGERIVRGYVGRTLPHFKPGDKGARAKGFVKSNYKTGLDPIEYFFHAMGGREGLVDTAVRTSQSGYMQRRLINALQDLKVEYDGTVRDTRSVIIEFKHGEDGADPSKTDWGQVVNVKKIIQGIVENRRRG